MERLILSALLLVSCSPLAAQQPPQPRPAVPVDAITGIVEAFRSHNVVAISDAHGNVGAQDFLISLVRDRRFTDVVDDVVVEWGNSRYQDVIDRFVNGEDVPYDVLRRVWRDTTQASAGGDLPIYEQFYRAVRAVNSTLPPNRRLRVLLGDPPIDWDQIRTKEDHRRWIEMREWYPASLLALEVLAKQRRALLVYGHGHFQRRDVRSNYETLDRLTDSIVTLFERATGTRVFIIWRDAGLAAIQPNVASWPTPSMAIIRDTVLGATDFASYFSPGSDRFAIRDGKLTPIPRSEYRRVNAEEQFEAVLYLGPPSSITSAVWTRELCADQTYMAMRLKRIELAGIPVSEADALKKHCAGLLEK
jgi:hypothetical protein